ncbi:hypothetical protein U1Q18_021889 [Sarracenia purpurea var. burkii]
MCQCWRKDSGPVGQTDNLTHIERKNGFALQNPRPVSASDCRPWTPTTTSLLPSVTSSTTDGASHRHSIQTVASPPAKSPWHPTAFIQHRRNPHLRHHYNPHLRPAITDCQPLSLLHASTCTTFAA